MAQRLAPSLSIFPRLALSDLQTVKSVDSFFFKALILSVQCLLNTTLFSGRLVHHDYLKFAQKPTCRMGTDDFQLMQTKLASSRPVYKTVKVRSVGAPWAFDPKLMLRLIYKRTRPHIFYHHFAHSRPFSAEAIVCSWI